MPRHLSVQMPNTSVRESSTSIWKTFRKKSASVTSKRISLRSSQVPSTIVPEKNTAINNKKKGASAPVSIKESFKSVIDLTPDLVKNTDKQPIPTRLSKKLEKESVDRYPTIAQETLTASASITAERLNRMKKSDPIRNDPRVYQREEKNRDEIRNTPRRSSLPEKPKGGGSLWSIIRNSIGKDLSEVIMPVGFCEPISMLQRLAEDFEYSHLLDKAAQIQDPLEQMAYVAAFTVSSYSSTANRLNKPFTPLVGETYEHDRRDDLGWRLISEQVSGSPPTSAQYCESKRWKCWKTFSMVSIFRGKYVKVAPSGYSHLVFKTGEIYSWGRVDSIVNNVFIGKMWLDNTGELEVVNHTQDCKCSLTFIPFDSHRKDHQKRVKGLITDFDGNVKIEIDGVWDSFIQMTPVMQNDDDEVIPTGPSTIVWRANEIPNEISVFYNFGLFTCQLNEPERYVAPTDSRNREDIRLMEEGRWDEADIIKKQLELRGRNSNKADKPMWFKEGIEPITKQRIFLYNDKYWNQKAIGDWSKCPDIFNVINKEKS